MKPLAIVGILAGLGLAGFAVYEFTRPSTSGQTYVISPLPTAQSFNLKVGDTAQFALPSALGVTGVTASTTSGWTGPTSTSSVVAGVTTPCANYVAASAGTTTFTWTASTGGSYAAVTITVS